MTFKDIMAHLKGVFSCTNRRNTKEKFTLTKKKVTISRRPPKDIKKESSRLRRLSTYTSIMPVILEEETTSTCDGSESTYSGGIPTTAAHCV